MQMASGRAGCFICRTICPASVSPCNRACGWCGSQPAEWLRQNEHWFPPPARALSFRFPPDVAVGTMSALWSVGRNVDHWIGPFSTNFLELLTVDEFNQMQWGRRVGGGEAGTGGATDTGPVEAPEVGAGQGVGTRSGNVSYMVGEGVTAPVPISQPLPPYPEEARRARIEGVVTIQAVVRKNGTVDNLRIIHGLGHGLDESAVNTIATRWKFKPGTLKDAPVDVQARIEVRFRLN